MSPAGRVPFSQPDNTFLQLIADGVNWYAQPQFSQDDAPLDLAWISFAHRTAIFIGEYWPGFILIQSLTDTDVGEHWTFSPPPGSGWLPASGIVNGS